jgi:hypothetical protein
MRQNNIPVVSSAWILSASLSSSFCSDVVHNSIYNPILAVDSLYIYIPSTYFSQIAFHHPPFMITHLEYIGYIAI